MAIERFFITPVTVLTAPEIEGRYHDQTRDWPNATERETSGWLARNTATEIHDNRDALVIGDLLYLPADDPISPYDRVQVDGTLYEVDGPIHVTRTPTAAHHLEVQLTAVTG